MKPVRMTASAVFALLFALSTLSSGWAQQMKMDKPMKPMGGMAAADAPVVPPVAGYSEGEKILFLHTEASDTEIAKILTEMMGSPVLVVPSLAMAPKEIQTMAMQP